MASSELHVTVLTPSPFSLSLLSEKKRKKKKKRSLWKASSHLYVVRANGAFNLLFSPLAFDERQDSKGKEAESEKQRQKLSTLKKKKEKSRNWIIGLDFMFIYIDKFNLIYEHFSCTVFYKFWFSWYLAYNSSLVYN